MVRSEAAQKRERGERPEAPRSPLPRRSLSPALLGVLALAAYLAASLALNLAPAPRCDVGAEEDIGCARGFETRERDGRRSFRWTDGAAAVRLHAPGYGSPLLLDVSLAAPRLGAPPVAVALAAGDTLVLADVAEPRRYRLVVPDAPLAGDVLTVSVASDTWRPPRDRRALGVQVSDVRMRVTEDVHLAGPLHALALLALGLSASRLTPGGSTVRLATGLAAITLAAGLWAALPERVAPFLPALALIVAVAALLPRLRGPAARPAVELTAAPLVVAALAGTAAETAFAAGALRGPWTSAAVLAQGAVTVWAVWRVSRSPLSLPTVLGVTLAVRLLAFAARLLTGGAGSDPDVELFYSYGRATFELGLPVVEYPSGALVPWTLMALPGSRELFALLLPLLNTLCDMAVVWGVWKIAERGAGLAEPGKPRAPTDDLRSALPLFYALSPLLLPFWYGKFDSLPAALLVLGLTAFLRPRPAAAGALLGLGGAIKWVPWLAAPALALHELRAARYHDGVRVRGGTLSLRAVALRTVPFAAGLLAAVTATSLPFALRDLGAFLAPYTLQGGRPLIGESVWFLPAFLLDPGLLDTLTHPWSNVESSPVPPALSVAAQALALAALLLPVLLREPDRRRTLALAALAPAVFLLLNRVFSPQYVLIISACALAAGAAVLRGREPLALVALLTVTQAANLLVWPHTSSAWLAASAALFVTAGAAVCWLATRAANLGSSGAARVAPARRVPGEEEVTA